MRRKDESIVPAADSDDVTLARHLARARRRVRTIVIVRYLLVAMSLAVVAASLAVAWLMTIPVAAGTAAFVVAAVAATAIACLRTPNVREIAATVDGRLRLADATVTAAALQGSGDPIARLIVRDAIAHLTDERMTSAFPFELGRAVKSAVVAAVICVVVAAVAARRQVTGSSASGGMRIASGESRASSSQRSSRTGDGPADQALSRTTMSAQSMLVPTRSETGAPALAEGSPRSNAESQSETSPGATASPEDSSGPGSSGRAAEPTGAAPRGQEARPGRAGGSGSENGAEGAGGIQQGGLRAETAQTSAPSAIRYRRSYRAARAQVDSAIARDQVPLSRRAYVRDYFLAIAPRD